MVDFTYMRGSNICKGNVYVYIYSKIASFIYQSNFWLLNLE